MERAERLGSLFREAAALPVGTVTSRADGYDWKKHPDGSWKRVGKTRGRSQGEPSSGAPEGPEGSEMGRWVAKLPHLPDSTFSEHFEDAHKGWRALNPKAKRKAVHDAVLKKMFEGTTRVPDNQQPQVYIMMGMPASGKSSFVEGRLGDNDNLAHIDPDEIKKGLPEYNEAVEGRAKNAASMVHQESSWLSDRALEKGIAGRRNFVFDGLGRATDFYREVIKGLQGQGYAVNVVMPYVTDLDPLRDRAKARAERTGRYVPDDVFSEDTDKLIKDNFKEFAQLADGAVLYNTDGFPPTSVWEKGKGGETIHDDALHKSFFEWRVYQALQVLREVFMSEAEKKPDLPPSIPLERFKELFEKGLRKELTRKPEKNFDIEAGEGIEMPVTDPPEAFDPKRFDPTK